MSNVDITSPYYPYIKVQEGFFNFKQYAEFPRLICDYLIDAPKGDYAPIDDNNYPRCRFWKYLYYDTEKPLSKPLPTLKQKLEVVYNSNQSTTPKTKKLYRLIPQEYIATAQTEAQTRIYVFMGRTIASEDDTKFCASVVFNIFTHYNYELNTKADEYSRTGAIVASLIEALNGVNITGVGTFSMSKRVHPDSGTKPIYDGESNVGQQLIIGLEMSTIAEPRQTDTNNMSSLGDGTFI